MSTISNVQPPEITIVEPIVENQPNPSSKASRCWDGFRSTCRDIGRGFCKAPWSDAENKDLFVRLTKSEVGVSGLIGLGCHVVKHMSPPMLAAVVMIPICKYSMCPIQNQLSTREKIGMAFKHILISAVAIGAGFSAVYFPLGQVKI